MRQIFSVRFFAAVGAVVGLFFLLSTVFAARQVIDTGAATDDTVPELHRIDLVEQVFSSRNDAFAILADGTAGSDTDLIIDGTRSLAVVAGTPGVDLCPGFGEVGACAVVADLLGEAVVWFALVPMGRLRNVEMPAIDTLDAGTATLVNGWQVGYANVLDRRCVQPDGSGEQEFTSYREFREAFGDDFISIFDIDERRLVAVQCRTRVPYAPDPVATSVPITSVPITSVAPPASDLPVSVAPAG